jgi:hypothetical protein
MDIDEIDEVLLEAIWISRWNKDKTALTAVLTPEESIKMCKDIKQELDKAGYEIVKKDSKDK